MVWKSFEGFKPQFLCNQWKPQMKVPKQFGKTSPLPNMTGLLLTFIPLVRKDAKSPLCSNAVSTLYGTWAPRLNWQESPCEIVTCYASRRAHGYLHIYLRSDRDHPALNRFFLRPRQRTANSLPHRDSSSNLKNLAAPVDLRRPCQ